jgi:hypothetical protein
VNSVVSFGTNDFRINGPVPGAGFIPVGSQPAGIIGQVMVVRVVKNSFCDLAAPVSGEMSRRIKESIDSELQLQLFNKSGEQVFTGTGRNVGLEIIEGIFKYL